MLDCRQSQAVLLSHSSNHSSAGSLGSMGEVTYSHDGICYVHFCYPHPFLSFYNFLHLCLYISFLNLFSFLPFLSLSFSLSLSLYLVLSVPLPQFFASSLCRNLISFYFFSLPNLSITPTLLLYLFYFQAEDMTVDDADDETDNISLRSAHTGITNRTLNSAPCLVPGTDDVITSGKIE